MATRHRWPALGGAGLLMIFTDSSSIGLAPVLIPFLKMGMGAAFDLVYLANVAPQLRSPANRKSRAAKPKLTIEIILSNVLRFITFSLPLMHSISSTR